MFDKPRTYLHNYSSGLDVSTHTGLSGFGPDMDMLPMDVNVTFFFDFVQGTIQTIEIINMTDLGNTSLGQYQREKLTTVVCLLNP